MKKILLEELIRQYKIDDYSSLYNKVIEQIEKGRIKPVKASGTNGKKPALYVSYWIVEEEKDYSQYERELLYEMATLIKTDYYLNHIEQYVKDREWVLRLNQYLKERREELSTEIAINERSFSIWQREKFLKQEQGKTILKRCGIELEALTFYETSEPIAYYVHNRTMPQNILIIENKDTFYTLRKYMMRGKNSVFGISFGTIIYGAGKGILRAFKDFSISAEPYMLNSGNEIYYFGDMDYEGIMIYESFAKEFGNKYKIQPFVQAYKFMLDKADISRLPNMKEGQNRNISNLFWEAFDEEYQNRMKEILQENQYIPQEIINIMDLEEE